MGPIDEAGLDARRSQHPKQGALRFGRAPDPPLRVLSADPPWPFKDHLPGPKRGAGKHYRCLSIKEICAYELPAIADDATLVMWRVSSMVEEAYQVVRAWDFIPKSEIVWIKMKVCVPCKGTGRKGSGSLAICESCLGEGEHEAFGMGHHGRGAHETVIIATRGRGATRISASERTTCKARMPVDAKGKAIHSAKPPEFYAKIQRMYEGPYGELFARTHRAGWWAEGDELGLLAPGPGVIAGPDGRPLGAAQLVPAFRDPHPDRGVGSLGADDDDVGGAS
jgi:N6-adenosine-specific RNA methylase IME4